MNEQLEKIVQNLIATLCRTELSSYPTLQVYRNSMRLLKTTAHEGNFYSSLFDWVEFDDPYLKDLLNCFNAEVVTLNDQITGLRLRSHDSKQQPIFWLHANDQLRGQAMSEFYDQVTTFMESIPEGSPAHAQRIDLVPCGNLITWRSVVNQIRNNPADAVFGSMNHPLRAFSSGTDLYVRARDRKDQTPVSTNPNLNQADLEEDQKIWFSIKRPMVNTQVL